MQILVVVANVQTKSLKTVVEKGFALTVIVRKLVGPKKNGNTISICGELDEFHVCCFLMTNVISSLLSLFERELGFCS